MGTIKFLVVRDQEDLRGIVYNLEAGNLPGFQH
jgi:hypothetical protein